MRVFRANCYDKNNEKQIPDVYIGVMQYPNDYPILSGDDVTRLAKRFGLTDEDIHFTFGEDEKRSWEQGVIINGEEFIWTIQSEVEPKKPRDEKTKELLIKYLQENDDLRLGQALTCFFKQYTNARALGLEIVGKWRDIFYWECDELLLERSKDEN